jgi:uncharacterized protein (DUF2235 family)
MADRPVAEPKKRLAVFLDGTWNTVNDNTNIWRLRALCAPRDETGILQLSYYDPGVGTGIGERIRGGWLGLGLNENVVAAYEWLIENYNPGDDIFIFGFSRGAYTARSLSGFISKCGLLKPGAALSLNQLFARYRLGGRPRTIRTLIEDRNNAANNFTLEEQWIMKYARPITIKFIGVWDTVGSLGIPNMPWTNWGDMQWLNTGIRTSNEFGFHALAIDEHRKAFAPTLWTKTIKKPPDPRATPPRTLAQVEQRWFAGAHANVGGGCRSDVLAQIPLRWMMRKAMLHGLAFREEVTIDGDVHRAPISDSYAEFMNGAYRAATLGRRFHRPIGAPPVERETETENSINETIDPSVFERWRFDPAYRPPNLLDWVARHGVKPENLSSAIRADSPDIVVPE